jgi:hypothetical protein
MEDKDEMREVTAEELTKMNALAEDLIKKRGEAIHWTSEIEAVLDELIVLNDIKVEQGSAFFDILYTDIRFNVKIKIFENTKLPSEFEEEQKKLVKHLKDLSETRNKFAHQLSLISLDSAYLIGKSDKPYKVDDKVFNDFKNKAVDTLAGLKAIFLAEQGVSIEGIGKSVWIPVDKIKSRYDTK